jgi:hypothetical protein
MQPSDPGLLAILEAKPGKQVALAEFLNTGGVGLGPFAINANECPLSS